jgi:4-alpha-glucanotransferase
MTSQADQIRRRLGIERLVLVVHDASLPSRPEEDIGRGSPYARGGRDFLRFARELGFTAVQLGPQGQTSRTNPSPYDGAAFSKSTLSIAFGELPEAQSAASALRRAFERAVATRSGPGDRVAYVHAYDAQAGLLSLALAAAEPSELAAMKGFERANASWLERDALYAALAAEHGTDDWTEWPDVDQVVPVGERAGTLRHRHAAAMQRCTYGQLLVARQHQALRTELAEIGLELYGDLQAGLSHQDRWAYRELLLEGYCMGAPPSRTNPEGQPWGYPVLDPRLPGAIELVRRRARRLLEDFDGLRIDHPHALVCPWVYRAGQGDALAAVQAGARLHASPDLPDHPQLEPLAIPRPAQLTRGLPRYADGWVRELEPEQIDRYARAVDAIVRCAEERGRDARVLACEVLSTWPLPVRKVMERYGLGRFRVTQKADPTDRADVYRSENARPEDWIMVGTHDTRPLWQVADEWRHAGTVGPRAAYLSSRLTPRGADRALLEREIATLPGRLEQAMVADLFLGPARNVSIFFADLMGIQTTYNAPGTVSDDNWALRVPGDYEHVYSERRQRGRAIDLAGALQLALAAKQA